MRNASILVTAILISGCSSIQSGNLEQVKTETVSVNQSENATSLLKIDIQQPIYNLALNVAFNNLPYHAIFDACPTTGSYKKLEKVVTTDNKSTPFFKKEKLDCESTVTISDAGYGSMNVEYKIILPYDFNTHSLKGFNGQLPHTHLYVSGPSLFKFGDDIIVSKEMDHNKVITSIRISISKIK